MTVVDLSIEEWWGRFMNSNTSMEIRPSKYGSVMLFCDLCRKKDVDVSHFKNKHRRQFKIYLLMRGRK